ncbi:MAG: aminoacyl-tRNA hydrolase [Bacteroidetes Order II. Incertae sedis bacterium]|nr:aminoacyl-tRNA hydrolase [Bacteroidetes Order II. bacterium]
MAHRLIIGLGNPGKEYLHTRHNVGFMVIDALAEKTKCTIESSDIPRLAPFFGQRSVAIEAESKFKGYPFFLLKPLTYMNLSGSAVKKVANKYGIPAENMLVIYDDIALPVGTLRIRPSGSAGGHNGLQDIIDELATDAIPRLRFGIGSAFERGEQSRYVLSPFAEEEQSVVKASIKTAMDASLTFVREGLQVAMNRYNRKNSL